MLKLTLEVIVGLITATALAFAADSMTYADLKLRNAVKLNGKELAQLMATANMVSKNDVGSRRSWRDNADGSLVGSSDTAGAGGHRRPEFGDGTWHIARNGTYCVDIRWGERTHEHWCRHLFKVGNAYYFVGDLEDGSVAREYEISN